MNYLNIKIKIMFAKELSDDFVDQKFDVSLFDSEKRANNSNQTKKLNSYLNTYKHHNNFWAERENFNRYKKPGTDVKEVCLRDILTNNTLFKFKSVDRWMMGENLTRKFFHFKIEDVEFNLTEADLVKQINLLKELKASRKHKTKSLNFRRLMKTQAVQGQFKYLNLEYNSNLMEREVLPYSKEELECLTPFLEKRLRIGWEPASRKDHEKRLLTTVNEAIVLLTKYLHDLRAMSKTGVYYLSELSFEGSENVNCIIINLKTPLNMIFDVKQFIRIYKNKTTNLIRGFSDINGENPFKGLLSESKKGESLWSLSVDPAVEITYSDDLYKNIAS